MHRNGRCGRLWRDVCAKQGTRRVLCAKHVTWWVVVGFVRETGGVGFVHETGGVGRLTRVLCTEMGDMAGCVRETGDVAGCVRETGDTAGSVRETGDVAG